VQLSGMKISILLFASCLILAACNNKSASSDTTSATGDASQTDEPIDPAFNPPKMYANDRFKDVIIKNTGPTAWSATGKAQFFDRTFGWAVMDGENQLIHGLHQVDAAAPEWGNFDFNFNTGPFDTTHKIELVLFERSPEDGSRSHELKIPLN
jgi:hypothetical protein